MEDVVMPKRKTLGIRSAPRGKGVQTNDYDRTDHIHQDDCISSGGANLGTTFVPVRRTCRIVLHDVYKEKPLGNDLLSQEAALQVPSALTGLTTGFGMLPGVPPSLKSPRDVFTTLG